MIEHERQIVADPKNPGAEDILQAFWWAYATESANRRTVQFRTTDPLLPVIEMQVTKMDHRGGEQGMLILCGFVWIQAGRLKKLLPARTLYDVSKKMGTITVRTSR